MAVKPADSFQLQESFQPVNKLYLPAEAVEFVDLRLAIDLLNFLSERMISSLNCMGTERKVALGGLDLRCLARVISVASAQIQNNVRELNSRL